MTIASSMRRRSPGIPPEQANAVAEVASRRGESNEERAEIGQPYRDRGHT
jgi:hypothetical protein